MLKSPSKFKIKKIPKYFKKGIDIIRFFGIIKHVLKNTTTKYAGIAHLAERHLAKVEVASSNLVARSIKGLVLVYRTFSFYIFIFNFILHKIKYIFFLLFGGIMLDELFGTYPVFMGETEVGELNIYPQGLYTVFSAKCRPSNGLWRLYLTGSDKVSCLGLMVPKNELLILNRRLSKSELKSFPHSISRAEISQSEVKFKASSTTAQKFADDNISDDKSTQNIETSISKCHEAPPASYKNMFWLPCPCPCSLFSTIEEKSLFGKLRGVLRSQNGKGAILAIPASQADVLKSLKLPFDGKIVFNEKEYFTLNLKSKNS